MTKHSNRKQTQIYLVINTYRAVNGDNNSIHETPALTCECIRGCWSLLIICCWCFCGGIFVMLCILQLAFYFCIMIDFTCLFSVSMVTSFSDWSLLFRFSLTFIFFFFWKKCSVKMVSHICSSPHNTKNNWLFRTLLMFNKNKLASVFLVQTNFTVSDLL